MQKMARKLHLWLGLILAVLIIIEAVTGLILAEPGIVGQVKTQMPSGGQQLNAEKGSTAADKGSELQGEVRKPDRGGSGTSALNAFGFAKGLHQGKVGSLNLKWVVNLIAIGLIILSLTGIYISIPLLRAKSKRE